jgi:hypothetical protein
LRTSEVWTSSRIIPDWPNDSRFESEPGCAHVLPGDGHHTGPRVQHVHTARHSRDGVGAQPGSTSRDGKTGSPKRGCTKVDLDQLSCLKGSYSSLAQCLHHGMPGRDDCTLQRDYGLEPFSPKIAKNIKSDGEIYEDGAADWILPSRVAGLACAAHPRSWPSTRGRTRLCPLSVRIIWRPQPQTSQSGTEYDQNSPRTFTGEAVIHNRTTQSKRLSGIHASR